MSAQNLNFSSFKIHKMEFFEWMDLFHANYQLSDNSLLIEVNEPEIL